MVISLRSASQPKRKILVVDDEPDILITLKTLLENTGIYDVTTNEYPKNALTDFETKTYDLLILDIRMPDINGFELYRQMKQILVDKGNVMTRVCFLTALADMGPYVEYKLEVSPNMMEKRFFVQKPVGNEDLLSRVQYMLET